MTERLVIIGNTMLRRMPVYLGLTVILLSGNEIMRLPVLG
jgi:hypothetical protein